MPDQHASDIDTALAEYKTWRAKWAAKKGEAVVATFDQPVDWFLHHTMPRVIIPKQPSNITAILVSRENNYGAAAPVGNDMCMLVLSDGNKRLTSISAAPKAHAMTDDKTLLAFAEKYITAKTHIHEDTHLLVKAPGSQPVDMMAGFMQVSHKDQPELYPSWGITHVLQTNRFRLPGEAVYRVPAISRPFGDVRKTELPTEAFDELDKLLAYAEFAEQQRSWKHFERHLDPEIMQLFAKANHTAPSVRAYNFLSKEDSLGKRHQQTIRDFPFLAEMLDRRNSDHPDMVMPIEVVNKPFQTDGVIDLAEKMATTQNTLLASFAEAAHTTEAVVKRAQGMPVQRDYIGRHGDGGANQICGYSQLFCLLGCIPDINTIPYYRREPEKFQALIAAVTACYSVDWLKAVNSELRHEFPPAGLKKLMAGMKNDMRPLIQKYGNGNTKQFIQHAGDVLDYIDAVMDVIVLPELVRRVQSQYTLKSLPVDYENMTGSLRGKLKEVLIGDKNLGEILELSERWHRGQGGFEDKIRTILRDGTWGKLIADTKVPLDVAPSGLTIVALNTAEALKEEGSVERMDHCVGGQADNCINRGLHVLSIRDRNGKSISTPGLMEKTDDQGKTELELYQHQGRGNTAPSDEAKAALAWLQKEIASGRIAVDFKAMEDARKKAQELAGDINARIGFNPLNDERRQLAFDLYKKAGLLSETANNPEAFFKETGLGVAIDDMIEEIRQGKYHKREQQLAMAGIGM